MNGLFQHRKISASLACSPLDILSFYEQSIQDKTVAKDFVSLKIFQRVINENSIQKVVSIQHCIILFFSNAFKVSDNKTQQNMPFENINDKSK